MKRKIAILFVLLSFFWSSELAQPVFAYTLNTVMARGAAPEVIAQPGQGLTYSDLVAYIWKGNIDNVDTSDWWERGFVHGTLAPGAHWGFYFYDPDTKQKIKWGDFTTLDPNLQYFFTQNPPPVTTWVAGVWVDNSGASGTSDVWIYQLYTHQEGCVTFSPDSSTTQDSNDPGIGSSPSTTISGGSSSGGSGGSGSGSSGGSGGSSGIQAPPGWDQVVQDIHTLATNPPPPPNWDQVVNDIHKIANPPPIPDPPDPGSAIPPTPDTPGMPSRPSRRIQPPPVDVPQPPPNTGKLPFDLKSGQPHIPVNKGQSKPFNIENPMSRLQHDDPNKAPIRGQAPPSPFTPPQSPQRPMPVYQGTPDQPTGTPPTPKAQAPSGGTAPSMGGSGGNAPIRQGSSSNPTPVPK
jgi:uncharacterized membrane protein YgcG